MSVLFINQKCIKTSKIHVGHVTSSAIAMEIKVKVIQNISHFNLYVYDLDIHKNCKKVAPNF